VAKLLLIAPTSDRTDVGEAWVSYQWVSRLARRHDVTVLTYYKRGRTPPSSQLPGVRVIEWAEPSLLGRAERLNSMLKPGYVPFYARARRWIRQALKAGERFDLAHQPVPVAMRYPSPVTGLGIPYVIGPVGGSLDNPTGFEADGDTAPWYVGLRALDTLRIRHDRWLRRTYTEAACVVGIAPYVGEFLHQVPLRRFEVLSETALEALPETVDRSGRSGPIRMLYVGRLVRTKGARDAIRALGLVRELPITLDLVGVGPDRDACAALVSELGLTDRVHFHGWVERDAVRDFYRRADVFVFPSYREPGGNVAFEAMGFGLPLIVADRGGPGNAVDESCGIRVTAHSPDQLARDIAEAYTVLCKDPELRTSMGAAARRRVAGIGLWDSKITAMEGIFQSVLAE
jgi:glycosyltransferase involved in cell wall biosynthesis